MLVWTPRAGVLGKTEGDEIMGTTTQKPSKRVRIVLCIAVVMAVVAIAPASGFAASWTSKASRPPRAGLEGLARRELDLERHARRELDELELC